MNLTIDDNQAISDQCRFLLMEMGIGVLNQKMKQVIQKIVQQDSGLDTNKTSDLKHTILKGINEIYQPLLLRKLIESFHQSQSVSRIDQLILFEQLNNSIALQNGDYSIPEDLSVRECLRYLPAFQANLQCYGMTSTLNDHCMPVHPKLWREHFRHQQSKAFIPCLFHKKNWQASADLYYLQDHLGRQLSFYNELSISESQALNDMFSQIDTPHTCYAQPIQHAMHLPGINGHTVHITQFKSPFELIDDESILIPYHAIKLSSFTGFERISPKMLAEQIFYPLQQLKQKFHIDLSFYQLNPLIIVRKNQLNGIIYRHIEALG